MDEEILGTATAKSAIASSVVKPVQPSYIVLHAVQCNPGYKYHEQHVHQAHYFDIPRLFAGANSTTALQGQHHVASIEDYLEDHPNISFAVCLTYDCNKYHTEIEDSFVRHQMPTMPHDVALQAKPYFSILREDASQATAESEIISLSKGLKKALAALCIYHPKQLQNWDFDLNLKYPYMQLFHCRALLNGPSISELIPAYQYHLKCLSTYFDMHLAKEYAEAEALFQKGLVSRKHWAKLFRPDEIVITMVNGEPVAHLTISSPIEDPIQLDLQCWSWQFDGKFFRKSSQLKIPWPSPRSDTVEISDLPAYPLRLDTTGLEHRLRRRGHIFWSCRKRKYVSYDVSLQGMEVQLVRLLLPVMVVCSLTLGDKSTLHD
jgi:hypothetical protein